MEKKTVNTQEQKAEQQAIPVQGVDPKPEDLIPEKEESGLKKFGRAVWRGVKKSGKWILAVGVGVGLNTLADNLLKGNDEDETDSDDDTTTAE